MLITANSPTSALSIQSGSTGNPSNPAAGETEKSKTKAASAIATQDTPTANTTGDTVSIRKLTAADIAALDKQAANDSNRNGSNLVYAEIWKDGIKVGQVYSDGRVQSNDGSTTAASPTSVLSAQTRAQQLASELGGEVRYPGQSDPKADKMRAQLRAAYGV